MAPLPPRNLPINTGGPGAPPPSTPRKPSSTPSTPAPSSSSNSKKKTPNRATLPPRQPTSLSSSSSPVATASKEVSSLPSKVEGNGQFVAASDGLVARADETTFHRRMRQILWDHRAARSGWEDTTDEDFARCISGLASTASEMDDVLGRLERTGSSIAMQRYGSSSSSGRDSSSISRQSESEMRLADELGALLRKHARLRADLLVIGCENGIERQPQKSTSNEEASMQQVPSSPTILDRLEKRIGKMAALSQAAEQLLLEATRAKGDSFAIVNPFWATWTLVSFVDYLQFLTSKYAVQTSTLRIMTEDLILRGTAPGDPGTSFTGSASAKHQEEQEAEVEPAEEEEDGSGNELQRQKARRRGELRERILQICKRLDDLRDDRGVWLADWFEDLCEVEVGRWDEG